MSLLLLSLQPAQNSRRKECLGDWERRKRKRRKNPSKTRPHFLRKKTNPKSRPISSLADLSKVNVLPVLLRRALFVLPPRPQDRPPTSLPSHQSTKEPLNRLITTLHLENPSMKRLTRVRRKRPRPPRPRGRPPSRSRVRWMSSSRRRRHRCSRGARPTR